MRGELAMNIHHQYEAALRLSLIALSSCSSWTPTQSG
jgi:hypothetical protein